MFADLATMQLMITAMAAAMAFSVLLVAWRMRPSEGLVALGIGLMLTAGTFAAYGLHSRADTAEAARLAVIIGNTCHAAALAASYAAICRFRRIVPHRWVLLAPIALVAVMSLIAVPLIRVVVCGLVYSAQALLVTRVAIRIRPPAPIERGAILFAIGTCAIGLMYLLRAAALLLGFAIAETMYVPGPVHTVNHLTGLIAIVLSTLGFLLMPFERRARRYRKQAGTDALTRIANRRGMAGAIDECFEQAARNLEPLAILMLDLDHFKRLNDAHGHNAGDAYLRAVADCLRTGVRRDDLLSRHGGEEFLVVLPRTGSSEARKVADQLRVRIAALAVPWQGETLSTTVSIGVATAVPTGPADRADLIDAADQALYAAKRKGRNRVEVSGASI